MAYKSASTLSQLCRARFSTCFLFASLLIGQNFVTAPFAAAEESWRTDQGTAMKWARNADYDDAIPVFERLHKEHPEDLDVTRDYLTVLDWSGHEDQAIALYKTLPDDREPDYVLLAAGHAYRVLGQMDDALAIYRKGHATYPENGSFAAGEIRILLDSGKISEAAQVSNDAFLNAGKSKELNSVVEEARHVYAVSEARDGRYTESLQILAELHENYPNDLKITRDYLAVEAWSGDDKEALSLYDTLPQGSQPDYVYAAVGKAYRNLHEPEKAAALYQEALQHYPDNKDFQVAEANSLLEEGHTEEANALAGANAEKSMTPEEQAKATQAEIKRHYIISKQEEAASLARDGKYDAALAILRPLVKGNPSNVSLRNDYLAVLAWSGHHKEATHAYESYGSKVEWPDYTLSAVGHAYRELKQFQKALAVYKRGQAQTPAYEAFTAGIVGCEMDMKHYAEAQKIAEKDLKAHGNRLSILLLASNAADANGKVYDALVYAQRAIAIDPNNAQAIRTEVYAEQRIGAANAAAETAAKAHIALPSGEAVELEGDQNASLVRWGKLEPVSIRQRYAGSDEAIETLDQKIAAWSKQGDAKAPELMRARFDRIVALRDRSRMQEAVNDYEDLRNQGVAVPAYVLGPVGDAYLYLRQPEAARDVYLQALKSTPDDFEIRRQLFFAYVECDDFDNAYATIDKLRDDQPIWYYLKGEPERQPNPNRAMVDIDAANARLYAGELSDASDRLQPIAEAAPFDVHTKEALGSLDLTRGWPRTALQEYRLGTRVQDGTDVGTQTGAAMAALDMRDYKAATEQIQALAAQYPEDLDVQRAVRQLEVYNMAELRVNSFYNMRSANNIQGGEGYGIDADLYSSPIDYNWRLFAGTGYAHEDEPNGEGTVGYVQNRAGIEYRDVNLVASAAPTNNLYNDSQRVGFMGQAEWTFNDQWTAGGGYESFSNDTPLRALNQGITASRYGVNTEWRQSEEQEVHADGNLFTFSDGNTRLEEDVTYADRLWTTPYWRWDAIVDGSSTYDSGNEVRDYYNPKLDGLGLVGARATETLYRRYETLYEHSLQISPGAYWEQGDGVRPAWAVTYQQELHWNDVTELQAGVTYNHQAYDGVPEDNVSFTLNLVQHF